MNLLQLVQQITSELGLPAPNAVISNPDTQIQQIFSFINRLGKDLARDFEWQELQKTYVFTTSAFDSTGTLTAGSLVMTAIPSTAQLSTDWNASNTSLPSYADIVSVDSPTQVTLNQSALTSGSGTVTFSKVRYSLPSDWEKQIPQTEWDRTQHWPMAGPATSQQWGYLQGGIVSTGPWLRFRIAGDKFAVNPNPPNGEVLSFEYLSNAWVIPLTGSNKSGFTLDTDSCIYDDSLMILGAKKLWRQEKGFESSIVERDYQYMLERCTSQNKSAPRLNMAPRQSSILIGPWNIPAGNWPAG